METDAEQIKKLKARNAVLEGIPRDYAEAILIINEARSIIRLYDKGRTDSKTLRSLMSRMSAAIDTSRGLEPPQEKDQ